MPYRESDMEFTAWLTAIFQQMQSKFSKKLEHTV